MYPTMDVELSQSLRDPGNALLADGRSKSQPDPAFLIDDTRLEGKPKKIELLIVNPERGNLRPHAKKSAEHLVDILK
jgi:hypothetical protein